MFPLMIRLVAFPARQTSDFFEKSDALHSIAKIAPMSAFKSINLGLSFLLELCLLAALGYWGFTTGQTLPLKLLLGLGTPLAVAVVWGLLLAPKAARRLREPAFSILKLALFAVACIALYAAGQPTLALIFAVVVAVNHTLAMTWRQEP